MDKKNFEKINDEELLSVSAGKRLHSIPKFRKGDEVRSITRLSNGRGISLNCTVEEIKPGHGSIAYYYRLKSADASLGVPDFWVGENVITKGWK